MSRRTRSLLSASLLLVAAACFDPAADLATCRQSGRCPPVDSDGGLTDGGQDAGTLEGGLAIGAHCSSNAACASKLCVDGYCCSSACAGQCEACDLAGQEGQCLPVSGTPHSARTGCAGSGVCGGTCDGTTREACSYPTVQCSVASCSNGVATSSANCNLGACNPTVVSCTPAICGANACATVSEVVAGYDFNCARLSDGTVKCWGENGYGQLGLGAADAGDTDNRSKPVTLPGLSGATKLTAGYGHACALFNDGGVSCWGANFYGQLGNGQNTTTETTTPQHVNLPATAIDVQAGHYHTCATLSVSSTRNIYCWGINDSGQLGNGTGGGVQFSSSPQKVCASGSGAGCTASAALYTHLALGQSHTCARTATSSLLCWGANAVGQLGTGTSDSSVHANPAVTSSVPTPASVYAGYGGTCIRLSDATVKCVGYNFHANLGLGVSGSGNSPILTPTNVCATYSGSCTATLGNVAMVSLGEQHGCALSGDAVRCWGSNQHGTLGTGGTTPNNTASTQSIPSQALGVAVGGFHSCAWLSDGSAKCWGWNGSGQVGNSSAAADVLSPAAVSW